ncbi:MAG: hypothetical protein FJX74_09735 [Armatimonadetes bacterium]|nr:hypothetical protein [Armatimonadota bacterium]
MNSGLPRPDRDPVRTTIVGGQPSVRTKESLPVPEGIERVILRAAGDPRFRRQLHGDRAAAVRKAGISLTLTEAALLSSVSAEQLDQLIGQAAPPPEPRRSFLQHAAAWALGLLGGAAAAGGCTREREDPPLATMGMRGDEPPGPATEGMRPDEPPPKERDPASWGIRPDEPPPPTRGIQPDVPPPKDAPSPGPVTGARPDAPPPQEPRTGPRGMGPDTGHRADIPPAKGG